MPNRLATETSLYLKQHANNPVDWFPWGPEALARAKELNRPIFLSIGYSACHWCHVMERESFESEATAALLNAHFVSVKVDREERPDLDAIYMTALQVMNDEGGGWPLSAFLTPDGTPFYAGTYFPPDDRYAPHRPSFNKLLVAIHEAWTHRREQALEVGQNVTAKLRELSAATSSNSPVSAEPLFGALTVLREAFDATHGGFGTAPKFPHALELRLLLRLADRFNDAGAVEMVKHTLTQMARGGIFDQLGGGFARYSTDARWLVPHFEKMLYDNALLTSACVEAYQRTADPFLWLVARDTLDYVIREMWSAERAFFSTQDADSEGEEGKFYVWSAAELLNVLGTEDAEFAGKVWGATRAGNFEGRNILSRALSDEDEAKAAGLSVEAFRTRLVAVRNKLYEAREKRVRPGRDEKFLTAWNALMISAFAQFGAVTDGEDTKVAALAADAVLTKLRGPDGRLFRTAGEGQPAKLPGYLEDYACLADALVTLYESTFDAKWLRTAIELTETMLKLFGDPENGGFFFTASDHEPLIARTKDLHDGSTPSGSAVAVTVLLRLAALTGRRYFAEVAERALRAARDTMTAHPAASGQMLAALDFHLGPVQQIVIAGTNDRRETERVIDAVRAKFLPRRVLASTAGAPAELAQLLNGKVPVDGKPTVYVCANFTCREPLVGADAVEAHFGHSGRGE